VDDTSPSPNRVPGVAQFKRAQVAHFSLVPKIEARSGFNVIANNRSRFRPFRTPRKRLDPAI
jgi:hypothetical protein